MLPTTLRRAVCFTQVYWLKCWSHLETLSLTPTNKCLPRDLLILWSGQVAMKLTTTFALLFFTIFLLRDIAQQHCKAICCSATRSYPMWWVQLCGSLSILWHCFSLGLEWKLIFSSPVATAEFSRFADILSAALSQHHLLGSETAQLEFYHLH